MAGPDVVQLLISSTWEAEVGGSHSQSLTGLHSKFKAGLGNLVRLCLKIKSQKQAEDQVSGRASTLALTCL